MAKQPKRKTARKVAAAIDLSQFVSLPAAARLAGVDETWMRQLVREGKVLGMKVGRNYLVDRRSAAAFERHPYLGRPREKDDDGEAQAN